MNIDTTTAKTAIFSSNEMSSVASATQAKRFSNTSFESEMKASESEQTNEVEETQDVETSENVEDAKKTEKKEDKKTEDKHNEKVAKEQDSSQTLKGEVSTTNQQGSGQNQQNNQNQQNQNAYSPLSDQVQAYLNANGGTFNFNGINAMNATSRSQLHGMSPSVDYTSIKMSDTDAKFFADLVSKTDMSMNSVAAEFQKALQNGDVKMVQSTAKASAALIEALKESSKTNQPFRIDFDRDVSVILQVDKAGKINANFIPGDKAVENYLRNNIDFLRQRFDEENISYGDLNYSKSRQEREEQQQRNNKERGNE